MSMINYNSGCKCNNNTRLSNYDACNCGQPGIIKTIQYGFLHGSEEKQFLNLMYVVGCKSFRPDIQKTRQIENSARDI